MSRRVSNDHPVLPPVTPGTRELRSRFPFAMFPASMPENVTEKRLLVDRADRHRSDAGEGVCGAAVAGEQPAGDERPWRARSRSLEDCAPVRTTDLGGRTVNACRAADVGFVQGALGRVEPVIERDRHEVLSGRQVAQAADSRRSCRSDRRSGAARSRRGSHLWVPWHPFTGGVAPVALSRPWRPSPLEARSDSKQVTCTPSGTAKLSTDLQVAARVVAAVDRTASPWNRAERVAHPADTDRTQRYHGEQYSPLQPKR